MTDVSLFVVVVSLRFASWSGLVSSLELVKWRRTTSLGNY